MGTSTNGSAARAGAQAAVSRPGNARAAASSVASRRFMFFSGGELPRVEGEARLVVARGFLLDDALGGRAIEDRDGVAVGGIGGRARRGRTHRSNGGAHATAQRDVAPLRLGVGDHALRS